MDTKPTEADLAIDLNRLLADCATTTLIPWWFARDKMPAEAMAVLCRRALAAEAFKRWVHAWLDGAGVPHDPDPEHTAEHGCRISGRMRYLLDRAVAAEADVAQLREAIVKARDAYWHGTDGAAADAAAAMGILGMVIGSTDADEGEAD
jgi:hypothetical protein